MRKITLLLVCGLAAMTASAQQDARFTHFYFNQLFFNPAYAGLENSARFNLLGRSQWTGYSQDGGSAPNTGVFSVSAPILRANMGMGGFVMYEKYAVATQLGAYITPNYQFKVGDGKLSIGIAPGIFSMGRDATKYRANDDKDPKIPASVSSLQFDLGGGIYYKAQKYFIGLSATHLTEPTFDLGSRVGSSTDKGQNKTVRHYYGIVGYNFEINPTITLTPNILYKSTFSKIGTQVEGGVMANINNKFFIGGNYAWEEAGSLLAGLSLLRDNSLRFSYSLDVVTAGGEAKRPTSHEIMLSYAIPVALKGPKPAIRTPRYRK